MPVVISTPWKRYAIIAELTKRLEGISPQLSKNAMQKLVFILQEAYDINCGYNFELSSYGPNDSQLLADLDLLERWGCVSIQSVTTMFDGYRIRPTEQIDCVREKATEFIEDQKSKNAIDSLIKQYGNMNSRDLALRATTLYVERVLRRKDGSAAKNKVCRLVRQIRPKSSIEEIERVVVEMSHFSHVQAEVIQ